MKAVILSASKDSRSDRITPVMSYSRFPLLGRPMIDWTVDQLSRQGIAEIAISTDAPADNVHPHRTDGADLLMSIHGADATGASPATPTGTAGALKSIQQQYAFFEDTFVVCCGTAISDIDFWDAIRNHHGAGAQATIIVSESETKKGGFGDIETDSLGRVTSFRKAASRRRANGLVSTGIFVFERRILDWIPDTGEFDIANDLMPLLISAGITVHAHRQNRHWQNVSTIEDIFTVSGQLLDGKFDCHVRRGRRVSKWIYAGVGARIRPAAVYHDANNFIGSGSVVEDGASLAGSNILAANTIVRQGARLRNCIVASPRLEIGPEVDLKNVILTDTHVIHRCGRVLPISARFALSTNEVSA